MGRVKISEKSLPGARWMEEALFKDKKDFIIVLNNIPAVVFKGYVDGAIDFFDLKAEKLTGYPLDDFASRRRKWIDLIIQDDLEEIKKIFIQGLKTTKSYVREYRIRNLAGQIIWIQERSHIVLDQAGKIEYISGIFFDITDRKWMEGKIEERTTELRDANERLTRWANELEQRNLEIKLLSQMGELLQSCRTVEEAYPVIQQCLAQLFVSDSGALLVFRQSSNMVEAAVVWGKNPPKENVFPLEDCWALRRGKPRLTGDSQAGLHCGHVKDPHAVYICVPMVAHGEVGMLHLLVGSPETDNLETKEALCSSVAEHLGLALATLKLQETLRDLSVRDPLTNLFNRRYMQETLDREIHRAQRQEMPVGIIMLDIDNFKQFNDLYGHEAGDLALIELGKLLNDHVRKSDIACRYGGEEFALILPGSSPEVATRRAEQLREAVKHMRLQHQQKLLPPITLSLGVAASPQNGETAQALLQASDVALYQAKEGGRDQVRVAPKIV